VKKLRAAWQRQLRQVDHQRLVFVDESGANTSMTRTRARALRGERALGAVPNGHWKTLTLLGALRPQGIAAAATIPAPTDADVFRAFVRNALVPALRPGDLVAWDNLSPHRAAGVTAMIEEAGARVLPLPPYSPDLSPIEPCWSKVKQHLRTLEARTEGSLADAAAEAFAHITAQDARGWFEKCGLCTVA
jgi:DDE superfamily endonuclease